MSDDTSQLTQIERIIAKIEARGDIPNGRPWILTSDVEQLAHLYAQRKEQVNQLAFLRSSGALSYAIKHSEQQIAMLDKAIREAEEQAVMHARKAAGRPD